MFLSSWGYACEDYKKGCNFAVSSNNGKLKEKDLCFYAPIPAELSPLVFTLPFQIMAARNCIAVGIDTAKRPKNRKASAHIYMEEQS